MVNRSKNVGTQAETLVRRYLPLSARAERRALAGAADQGDLWAYGGRLVVEVKSRKGAHSPADVERWLTELERETIAAMAAGAPVDVALLVVKRVGSGPANIGQWHAYARPGDASYLLSGISVDDGSGWVLMPLWLASQLADRRLG